jgi:A/G-specific adenine glycosylase
MPSIDGPDLDPAWVERVRLGLVSWYEQGHRDLPWRRDRDPYRIMVSELMLVQTTVAAVIPYFERFLEQFPTVTALAEADEAAVLKAWEGLGYYRRARQLHAAAKQVVRDHSGAIPRDPEALRALPGVGRYIAGAIRSFAFDLAAPVVEANTERVLARLIAWDQDLKSAVSHARLWQAAERLVPSQSPGRFNQALIELGASICSQKEPSCLVCPLGRECLARSRGLQDALPVKTVRARPLEVKEACVLVERDGRWLIVQRGPGRLWEGFWELPTIHLSGADPAGRSFGEAVDLAEGIRRLTGMHIRVGPMARTVRYSVTKHQVELSAHGATCFGGRSKPGPGLVAVAWETPEALEDRVFGSAMRRLLRWFRQHGARSPFEGR